MSPGQAVSWLAKGQLAGPAAPPVAAAAAAPRFAIGTALLGSSVCLLVCLFYPGR